MRLIFAFTVLAVFLTGPVMAQDLTSEKGKLSYAVGWDIGEDIQRRGAEFDVETVIAAIRDSSAGSEPQVPADEMDTAPEPLYFEDYARTGEITGVISFNHFMDPKTAVRIIINNQFKRELYAGFEGQRWILNKEINLVGASLKAGNIALESFSGNAYFLSTTFGSSLLKPNLMFNISSK